MEKFFNTAGPVRVENNYMIDPLKRINRDEIMTLIDNWRYFILHAPRQTGKTSSLLALKDYINKTGVDHPKGYAYRSAGGQAQRRKSEKSY